MDSNLTTETEFAADEDTMRAIHQGMIDAWNAGDAAAFAAPFTEDATIGKALGVQIVAGEKQDQYWSFGGKRFENCCYTSSRRSHRSKRSKFTSATRDSAVGFVNPNERKR
jgi:uncharacterized ParB-like nuclease family protein